METGRGANHVLLTAREAATTIGISRRCFDSYVRPLAEKAGAVCYFGEKTIRYRVDIILAMDWTKLVTEKEVQ